MAMSKKDYIAIADIFHKYTYLEHKCSVEDYDVTAELSSKAHSFIILNELMQYMKKDNPRFDKTKFLEKVAAPHG